MSFCTVFALNTIHPYKCMYILTHIYVQPADGSKKQCPQLFEGSGHALVNCSCPLHIVALFASYSELRLLKYCPTSSKQPPRT